MAQLTFPQVEMYLRGIPELEYRRHASNAILAWIVSSALGGKTASPDAFLPSFAHPATRSEYTPLEASAARVAFKLGFLTQQAVDRLDWDEVARA